MGALKATVQKGLFPMTGKERALATLAGRRTDRVPVHHLQFSGHAARVILGRECFVGGAYLQWQEIQALWQGPDAHRAFEARCEEDALAIARACGHDILRLGYWRWSRQLQPIARPAEDTFVVRNPAGRTWAVTYRPDLELLTWPGGASGIVPQDAAVADDVSEAVLARRVDEEEARASAAAPDPEADTSMAAAIRKYPDYLVRLGGPTVYVDMMAAAELAEAALWPALFARLLMARARRYARDAPRMAAAGVQVNFSGMDICTKDGPSISPAMFREIVLPALKWLVDACHRCGLTYIYSSDGNFWPVADAMFDEAGVDGWMEVDRSAGMELRDLRRRYPHKTFIGNIPVQVLHRGTRADVVREAMTCLEAAHEYGGIIVGCSNMIMPGTPPDNIVALLETIAANR